MKKYQNLQITNEKTIKIPLKKCEDSSEDDFETRLDFHDLLNSLDEDTINKIKNDDFCLGKRNLSAFNHQGLNSNMRTDNFSLENNPTQHRSEQNKIENFIFFGQKKVKTELNKESLQISKSKKRLLKGSEYKQKADINLSSSPVLFILDDSGNLLQWCQTRRLILINWKKVVGGNINHFLVSKDKERIQIAFDQTASLKEYSIKW